MTRWHTLLGAVLVSLGLSVAPARADHRELRTLESAARTVKALGEIPLRGIPHTLIRDCQGVAIIPGVVKAGLVIDARFGRGVVLTRQANGWSGPVFVTLSGAGVGLQGGVESTDVVLVFRTAHSLDHFLKGKGKLTLGADVSVAAGPLGRESEAGTDLHLKAEIWSYSRSRGLFAGASLEGAAILVDHKAMDAFYAPQTKENAAQEAAAVEHLKVELNHLGSPPQPPPPTVIVVPASTPPPWYLPQPSHFQWR